MKILKIIIFETVSGSQNPSLCRIVFAINTLPCHLCYTPLQLFPEIGLQLSNEQEETFTIWKSFVPALFIQTPVSRKRNEIFRSVRAKILVSSWAFIHSLMKVTSPHSSIHFPPLSEKKPLFRSVPGGHRGPF